MILSILTPAVPSRFSDTTNSDPPRQGSLELLMHELERQIGDLPVEHLIFSDNKRRTIGEKRDALLRAARGDYVTFVDDDDWVSEDYVASLVAAISSPPPPDVITFKQLATVNQFSRTIEFKLGNPNEPWSHHPIETLPPIKRNAWHVCAWRRELAILSHFPAINYGEDWAFAEELCRLKDLRSEHIDKVLHFYRHDASTTESPLENAERGTRNSE